MVYVKRLIVDGLEVACRATRFLEWIPGWRRVYPTCLLARLSSRLDARWTLDRWPVHDEDGWDAWERWFDNQQPTDVSSGHWHAW